MKPSRLRLILYKPVCANMASNATLSNFDKIPFNNETITAFSQKLSPNSVSMLSCVVPLDKCPKGTTYIITEVGKWGKIQVKNTSMGVSIFFSLILSYFCFLVPAFNPCQGRLNRHFIFRNV